METCKGLRPCSGSLILIQGRYKKNWAFCARRMQPGNVNPARVVRVTETIHQQANQHFHGPAYVQGGCL
eukprot:2915677-Pleurochrysis_carterae.AAC.2